MMMVYHFELCLQSMTGQVIGTAQAIDRCLGKSMTIVYHFELCLQPMMGQLIGVTEVHGLERGQGYAERFVYVEIVG